MAFQFEFDAGTRVIRIRFEGLVLDDELVESHARTAGYIQRTQARAGITDFTDATSFQVSSPVIRAIADSAPAAKDPSFVRVVVARAALEYGLARMYQILGEATRPEMEVVRSREESYSFLGIEDPQFQALPPESIWGAQAAREDLAG
jgi:hypothetical protein